jgi:hypothetical protein
VFNLRTSLDRLERHRERLVVLRRGPRRIRAFIRIEEEEEEEEEVYAPAGKHQPEVVIRLQLSKLTFLTPSRGYSLRSFLRPPRRPRDLPPLCAGC